MFLNVVSDEKYVSTIFNLYLRKINWASIVCKLGLECENANLCLFLFWFCDIAGIGTELLNEIQKLMREDREKAVQDAVS